MPGNDRSEPSPSERGPELSTLQEALRSQFRLELDDGQVITLTLHEITVLGARPGWESFSLIFGGPYPLAFGQGIFQVEHADLGRFPLSLVAVYTEGDGQHYEAVFVRPAA